jgi:hypothetical protein
METLSELDNLKQQFAEYEDLLVELQAENEEMKQGGGGGSGGGELKALLEAEKKKNIALQEELDTAFTMLNEETEKTDLLTEELARLQA